MTDAISTDPVAAPGEPARGAMRHDRRRHVIVFVTLGALTLLELGVVRVPGIARDARIIALIGLAIAKAGFIAYFFMHLKDETRALRLTVLGPFAAPAIYALALMADAGWRFLR
jgi:caa(3)-type oxidase subunit IV